MYRAQVFHVGDTVIATKTIRRVDGRSHLDVGNKATVTSVTRGNDCQILSVDILNSLPMCDVVCFDNQEVFRLEFVE